MTDSAKKTISFIIPCYKSEGSVGLVIDEIREVVAQKPEFDYQIVAVNDCSPDGLLGVIVNKAEEDERILAIEIAALQKRLSAAHVALSLDKKAVDFLVEKGYDPAHGARPLRRVVQTYVEDPLADLVLAGKAKARMRARLAKDGQSLKF